MFFMCPPLYSLLKSEDYLLLSANLAPEGIDKVLFQYDNQPTKDWLTQFLTRFGEPKGQAIITAERSQQLDFISARFIFSSTSILRSGVNEFVFETDDQIDLFTSYRYSKDSLRRTLSEHRIDIVKEFISQNGEEGVFICQLQ